MIHLAYKREFKKVGLEVARAAQVSAQRRLVGKARAEMTVGIVAPKTG